MRRITYSNGEWSIPLTPDDNIGFVINATGDKGWVQRLDYESGAWRLMALESGAQGNGWTTHGRFLDVITWLQSDIVLAVFRFDTSQELFRWLGSKQPLNL